MGNLHSAKEVGVNGVKEKQEQAKVQIEDLETEEQTSQLTEEQKLLLKSTWKDIEKDVQKVGVVMFVRLFETHPDIKESFMPFKGVKIEEVKISQELQNHALRVMGILQKVITRLDSPEKMEAVLDEIGKAHYHYGAVEEYVDYVGPQFLTAIQPSLSVEWSLEAEKAWVTLFRIVAWRMKRAIRIERYLQTKK